MLKRWLDFVLLYCEGWFKKGKGFKGIGQVEAEQAERPSTPTKKPA